MASLSYNKEAEIIQAFHTMSRKLDDLLLNTDNPYFEGMVCRFFPPELQLNKTNVPDTVAPFLNSTDLFPSKFMNSAITESNIVIFSFFFFFFFFFFGMVRSPFYLSRGLHFTTYSMR